MAPTERLIQVVKIIPASCFEKNLARSLFWFVWDLALVAALVTGIVFLLQSIEPMGDPRIASSQFLTGNGTHRGICRGT